MHVGEAIRRAAQTAVGQHARGESWQVRQTTIGPDVTILPTGQCVVLVRIALQGGAQHCFEYRCDATGDGTLWPVDCP